MNCYNLVRLYNSIGFNSTTFEKPEVKDYLLLEYSSFTMQLNIYAFSSQMHLTR